jgi:putative flippase GtrA
MIIISRELLLFLFSGGIAAVVNFSTRFFYDNFMTYGSAVICSYLTAMIVAFFLMRLIVFERTNKSINKEFSFFVLVNIVAIGLTWFVSVGLADQLFPKVGFEWYRYEVAHFFGIIVPAISSYYGHKNYTFR